MSKKTKNLIIFIILGAVNICFAEPNAAPPPATPLPVPAEPTAVKQDQYQSSLAAKSFYDIGYELYNSKDADFPQAKQAIIFLNTTLNLDSRANYVLPDIINIAWKYPEENFSDAVRVALDEYVDRPSDLEITSRAVQYLLERLSSREDREQLLQTLLNKYEDKNLFFASDLAAQIGFLKAETADTAEAQKYLMRACLDNKYNSLAFDKLAELAEADSNSGLPVIKYLENFRYEVRINPLNFKAVIDFARLAESLGVYESASAGYRYCEQLHKYLNPRKIMPAELYRPWMLSSFNARDYGMCRQILERVRGYDVFDVMVEAIAAASAKQGGDEKGCQVIRDGIKRRAAKILSGELKASAGEYDDYAWFFCFANDVNDVNSQDALTWATKAYDADSNSTSAASFFAYALIKHNQIDLAKPVLEKVGTVTQASAIAKAEIIAGKDANTAAKEILKSAVSADPGTFEAQRAKAMLKKLGSEYVPVVDPNILLTVLKNDFGPTIFSEFAPPEKMITAELHTGGSAFSYGSEINAELAVVNNYSEPMIVCPDALFKGNVRVDARISGDLSEQIDNLIVKTVRPSHEITHGNALFIPLQLVTGKLKRIMESHPQAELNLEVTVYLDPRAEPNGQIQNLYGLKPVKAILKLRKLDLNTKYLQQRLDAFKKGHQGQKIKSAQLFAGLLAEQQSFYQIGTKYRFIYAEPELLSSAIARCLTEDDWVLKVQTMAALLKLKLDYRLTDAVSAELHNKYWPVRLMAVFVLAKNQDKDFLPVLKWTANNDGDPVVKDMAAAMAAEITNEGKTAAGNPAAPAVKPQKPPQQK